MPDSVKSRGSAAAKRAVGGPPDNKRPRTTAHDDRHRRRGVALAVVSKTLRHKNVATTVDLYGHLTRDAADDGVSATCAALDAADTQAA